MLNSLISFEVSKKTNSYYGMIQSKIDDFFNRKNQKYVYFGLLILPNNVN